MFIVPTPIHRRTHTSRTRARTRHRSPHYTRRHTTLLTFHCALRQQKKAPRGGSNYTARPRRPSASSRPTNDQLGRPGGRPAAPSGAISLAERAPEPHPTTHDLIANYTRSRSCGDRGKDCVAMVALLYVARIAPGMHHVRTPCPALDTSDDSPLAGNAVVSQCLSCPSVFPRDIGDFQERLMRARSIVQRFIVAIRGFRPCCPLLAVCRSSHEAWNAVPRGPNLLIY